MVAETGSAEAQEIEVGNEFAVVKVRKISTRNGVRLEIFSPRLGYAIRLDALALESLTWQSMDIFTKFLETPFGPGPQTPIDGAPEPPEAHPR